MKYFSAAVIIIALFFAACQKTNTYVVHGQIVDTTGSLNAPIATTTFSLKVFTSSSTPSGPNQKTLYTFATDATGNFNVSFDAKNIVGIELGYPFQLSAISPNIDSPIWYATEIPNRQYDYNAGVIKTKKQ
ncbi:MAG: hypothetical protein H0X33_14015 [Taibaiella sp.]|nr:hypothetical protein [Taibaiella sp.]